jgi:hypothetical protein
MSQLRIHLKMITKTETARSFEMFITTYVIGDAAAGVVVVVVLVVVVIVVVVVVVLVVVVVVLMVVIVVVVELHRFTPHDKIYLFKTVAPHPCMSPDIFRTPHVGGTALSLSLSLTHTHTHTHITRHLHFSICCKRAIHFMPRRSDSPHYLPEQNQVGLRVVQESIPLGEWAALAQSTDWKVRGSNPGGSEIFGTCPDRP